MIRRSLVINVDSDGVLYPFIDRMLDRLDPDGSRGLGRPDRWDAWTALGIEKEEWYRAFHEGIEEGDIFRRGAPYPGAMVALQELVAQGHRVRIVTNKNLSDRRLATQARVNFLHWWEQVKGPLDCPIIFSGGDKRDFVADVVIDDHPDIRGWGQQGALNLLWHQPWNCDTLYFAWQKPVRVRSWSEVFDQIDERGKL